MMNDSIIAALALVPVQSNALVDFCEVGSEATGCQNQTCHANEESVLLVRSCKELNVEKSVQWSKKDLLFLQFYSIE